MLHEGVSSMRVLIANTFYAPDVVGGAELSVQGIAEQMVRLGHEVSVLTTGRDDGDDVLNGVKVLRRKFRGLMSYAEHRSSKTTLKKMLNKPLTVDNPFNKSVIKGVLDLVRPQALLTNNLFGITPELWRCAHSRGIPIMHTVRDYALLCPNSTLICSRRTSCGKDALPWCKVMRSHQRRCSKLVNTVAAPSNYALKIHDDCGFFIHAKHEVIPNAVRFDAASVKSAMQERMNSSSSGLLQLVYLGRLVEEKGVGDLLDAMKDFGKDEVELHLAGRGPLEDEAKRLASEGIPVDVHGFLNQEQVDELLMSCDVLVAPSRYAETFGRVVLDAYRNAMPAIVSDAGALPEVLQAGTGAVFPAGDVTLLQRAISGYLGKRDKIMNEGSKGASALLVYTVEDQALRFIRELEALV